MKVEFGVVVIVSILSITSADVYYRGQAVHPDYPGQCYYEELKQPIPKNQSFRPINTEEHCKSIYCRADDVLLIEYCGRNQLNPNETCKIVADIRRPYPECCPTVVCEPEDNCI